MNDELDEVGFPREGGRPLVSTARSFQSGFKGVDAELETSHRTDDKVGFSSHDEKFIAKINTQIKVKNIASNT